MRRKYDPGAWEDEFRGFVARYRSSLLRTATLFCSGNKDSAEDLVQTTLLRVYVNWRKIRPDGRERYARRILANAHIDERRRPHVRHEQSRAELPDTTVDGPTPMDPDAAVFRALATLPPRMRAAVVFRHVLDVSVADTADALGCSEGNVKSQTARGLAQLRAELTESPESARDLAASAPVEATRRRNH